ncbi:MAG TPA: DUF3857 domain-containing protein, partial [Candidatus Acidoferrum sp.]|nr:DUF3857 domain-containing protein [Candidatus Acidoferrum sp.]
MLSRAHFAQHRHFMSIRLLTRLGLLLAIVFAIPSSVRAGEEWLPINPDELKMTSEAKAPGAQAIYLYRQVDRDDVTYREKNYARVKIFTEEGRKYANIEIPFVKDFGDIRDIQARTIRPDGTIIDFDGKVYENTIVKAKGVKYLAKTFTMPGVQTGSIVEYRFTRLMPVGWVDDSSWLLSEELFTRRAKFSLHQAEEYAIVWSWPRGLPPGTQPPMMDQRVVRLEVQDVPAFQIEDYMPPQNEMKYRVDFTYTRNGEKDLDKFWKQEAKNFYIPFDAFTNKHKDMEQAVSQIVSPSDTPQQKLEKIYARCQKVRNTSFEREKTQKEKDREKLKEIHNVEDLLQRGYGDGRDITWLFVALARAAGFDASPIWVATRNTHFFDPKLRNSYALNSNVVLVKLDGKDLYLDPGVAFAPFGILPWSETGVTGLRFDKDGGTWVITTSPNASSSGIERTASLQLDELGNLDGKASLTFKGLSALRLRSEENDADGADRNKLLEDEIKALIPVSAQVELTNNPDWSSSSNTLVAEYHVQIPGWASVAGRRTLVPNTVFSGREKRLFESANRVNPIYFAYPYTDVDDVTIA